MAPTIHRRKYKYPFTLLHRQFRQRGKVSFLPFAVIVIRSVEGLTLETSVFGSLYCGQVTKQIIK